MKSRILPALILFMVLIIVFDVLDSHNPQLIREISDINRMVFSTGYEWTKDSEGKEENPVITLLKLTRKEKIGKKEYLSQWTYPNPIEINLFTQKNRTYQIFVYEPRENPIGRPEGLILEYKENIYLLPGTNWDTFIEYCRDSDGRPEKLMPSLEGRNIVFYSLYSQKEGSAAGEYRYVLEKDTEGVWQLSLAGRFNRQSSAPKESEVNLLIGEINLLKGISIPYEEILPDSLIYTMEIRDILGRNYKWQVSRSSEESVFRVCSISEEKCFLLTGEELKRVSPPVSRLIGE